MAEQEPSPLTYVPETVLKKRKDNEQAVIRRKEQAEARKLRSKENRKLQFKRAEQFIKEYRLQELDSFRLKRNKKRQKSSHETPESRLLFVTRIGGTNDMHPKTKKILYLLRLRKLFYGVFIILNNKTAKLLKVVEPYVTYGYPNLRSIKELILKKGVGRINKERIPLTDNSIIEKALGKHGIICIEDLVHEIASVGSHFMEASSFLQPFKLRAPDGGLQRMKKHFKDGGDAGNREDLINDLIQKMN
ncbi:60S ribosomal protein L7-2-like [Nymphaea colorata]|nr:60S ribosomal protein L7-2-like [Nymphaea colorata]